MRADKPGEKGRSGRHERAFASGGKAEAAEVARTVAPSKKDRGDAHVYILGQRNFFYLWTEDK
jgi:hypothetical protein